MASSTPATSLKVILDSPVATRRARDLPKASAPPAPPRPNTRNRMNSPSRMISAGSTTMTGVMRFLSGCWRTLTGTPASSRAEVSRE